MVEQVLALELGYPHLLVDDRRHDQPLDVVRVEVVALDVVGADEHAGHQRVVGDMAVPFVEGREGLLDLLRPPDRLDDPGHPAAEVRRRSRATPIPRSRRRARRRRRHPRGSRRPGRSAGLRSRLHPRFAVVVAPAGRQTPAGWLGDRLSADPRPAVVQLLAELLQADRAAQVLDERRLRDLRLPAGILRQRDPVALAEVDDRRGRNRPAAGALRRLARRPSRPRGSTGSASRRGRAWPGSAC